MNHTSISNCSISDPNQARSNLNGNHFDDIDESGEEHGKTSNDHRKNGHDSTGNDADDPVHYTEGNFSI